MKRLWFTTVFIALILLGPVSGPQYTTSIMKSSHFEESTIHRVYAEDLSKTISSMVSVTSYKGYVEKLTENGSRYFSSADNAYAREWIASELETVSDGRIEVEILGNHESVVGILPGYIPYDAPIMMVGGHYDSVVTSPGANDDGTGVAAALELARVMSQFEWPLDIYFGFWNAEEVGLIGSDEVAEIFVDREIQILAYYNIDMLLVVDSLAPSDERVLMVYSNLEFENPYIGGQYWAELTRMMSKNVGRNMIVPVAASEFGGWLRSDHYSFFQNGYSRSLFAHESGFEYDVDYHQPTDTWDNPAYDYTVAAECVASIGAAMAFTMARTYGESRTVHYEGGVGMTKPTEYYFAISTDTEFEVRGNWSERCNFNLYSPQGQLLESFISPEPSTQYSSIILTDLDSQGLYTLEIVNDFHDPILFEIDVIYDMDVDWDGILDKDRSWFSNTYFSLDSDFDGLSDGEEILLGTNRYNADSDSDGISDGFEVDNNLDPLINDANEDPDGDGLSNLDEFTNNTLPHNSDTDADIM
ncbi:MAG: M28 family peptidase, partial [Candidatus Hodarchaeota archaeon]